MWSDVGYLDECGGVHCLVLQTECMNDVGEEWSRAGYADTRQGMKGSRLWWEECGAGLDMQTGYEGEQVWWEECVAGLVMQTE